MNFIVTVELYRKGFVVKTYPTLEQAEKKVKTLIKLIDKDKYWRTEKHNIDLSSYRKYEVRNDLLNPIFCSLALAGEVSIYIYRTKINKNKFIENLIKAKEFQASLFEIDLLDKIDMETVEKKQRALT